MTAVQTFAFGEDGKLWVGGANDIGYFETQGRSMGDFHSLREFVPESAADLSLVWNVVLHNGETLFATNSHILRWNGSTFTYLAVPALRRIVLMESEGRVFLSSGKIGLCELVGSSLDELIPQDHPGGVGPMWVEQQSGELLTFGTNGLFRIKNDRIVAGENNTRSELRRGILASVVRLSPNFLAAGTLTNGIYVFDNDGQLVRHLVPENGLPIRLASHLFVDRERNLWVTSTKSIHRISNIATVEFYNHAQGLPDAPIESITSSNGRVFLATNEGEFFVKLPESSFSRVSNSPVNVVRDIEYFAGDLLAARFNGVHVSSDTRQQYMDYGQREIAAIFRSQRHDQEVYFADINQVSRFRRNDDGTYVRQETLTEAYETVSLVEDGAGNRLIGTSASGVLVAPPASSERATFRPDPELGLPAAAGLSNVMMVGDTVVAHTAAGFFTKGPGDSRFASLLPLSGFRPIKATKPSARGDAWAVLVHDRGAFNSIAVVAHLSLRPSGGVGIDWYELPELRQIGMVRSLRVDEDPVNPSLWVGGTDGLLRFALGGLARAGPPGPPRLLPSRAEGKETTGHSAATQIPYAENRMSFDFTTTQFARRPLLRYQTRLVGLESDWSAPTNTPTREYPFLDDRDYRFEVRMISAAGLVGEPATYRFIILPPWYRTGWAYLAYAAIGGLLLFAGDRVRVSTMKRRTRWLEEQVRQRTADLEKANAAKTDFVARVNHDIRNPINGVLGLTLALEQTSLNPEQRRMAGTIKQCARFLAALVEEVLDFAEIESGSLRLKAESFNLREMLAASVATIEPLATAARCPITTTVDPEIPAGLTGDASRVQQILVNFLSNAVKFGAGAPIVVTATALHRLTGRLVVRFGVRDQGPGLSEAEQKQLFLKFSRGHLAVQQKIKGTGLGLAVCRLLAEKMSGRVGVESRPGHGAEFFLEIPLEVEVVAAESAPSIVATNARVLVVEDEEYNAISLIAMLGRLGFQVDRCADGLAALEYLARHRYEIVFLDWELPHLNGIDVARRFRASEPADRRTLIIATTAYASSDKQQACRDAGMDEFVAKPLTPDRIVAAIRGHSGIFSPATSILVRDETRPAAEGIDLSLFAYLADDAGGVAAKVAEFLQSCEAELKELQEFLAEGRGDALRQGAHRFLSQCRFVGAVRMAELALALEKSAYDPTGKEARGQYAALRAEFDEFRARLQASTVGPAPG